MRALEAEQAGLERSLSQAATQAAERVEQGKRLKQVAERLVQCEERWLDIAQAIEALQT